MAKLTLTKPTVHIERMFEEFKSFLHTQFSADVTLVCRLKRFQVHKIILCASSSFFKHLLADHTNDHATVILDEYPEWAIEQIVEFIYGGEIQIHQSQIRELFEIGRSLQIAAMWEFSESDPVMLPNIVDDQAIDEVCQMVTGRRKQSNPMRHNGDEVGIIAPQNSPNTSETAQMGGFDFSVSTTLREIMEQTVKTRFPPHNEVFSTPMTNTVATPQFTTPMMSPIEQNSAAFVTAFDYSDKSVASTSHSDTQSHHGDTPIPPFNNQTSLNSVAATSKMAQPKRRGRKPKVAEETEAVTGNQTTDKKRRRGRNARTWTNEDLKNALEAVHSSRMNTSQASKAYGIPYNSLLMYVRGKYGKTINVNMDSPKTELTAPQTLQLTSPQAQPQDLRQMSTQQSMPGTAGLYSNPNYLQYADPFPSYMSHMTQIMYAQLNSNQGN